MKEKECIPEFLKKKIQERIELNPKTAELREKRKQLLLSKNYIKASEMQKQLRSIEDKAYRKVFEHCSYEVVAIDKLLKTFSQEDLAEWNLQVNCMIFLCDMIERMSIEANQLLRKYHPDCSFEMFDRISEIGKEASDHISYMSHATEMVYQTNFGDYADSMYELIINKAKSFSRRMSYVNELKEKQKQKEIC